jgi:hypothetical protein
MSDIALLFARDPLELTDQDLDVIIAKFREARSSFGNAPAQKPAAKPKSASLAALANQIEIKL